MNWTQKLSSRKFWLSVAGMLSGIATTVAGFATESETIAKVGVICAAVSAGIYAICEALVDAASASGEAIIQTDSLTISGDTMELEEVDEDGD